MNMTRLGIYGGSFNPVHNGHLRVAQNAIASLRLDKLLVIPAAVSPFKIAQKEALIFDRVALLSAAFAGMEKVEIDLRELRRGGVSWTIDTVREIHRENPDAKLYLIVGEDSLEGLPRWKEYDKLQEMCEISVFPRTIESSTMIRERLMKHEAIADLVPPTVVQLIEKAKKAR